MRGWITTTTTCHWIQVWWSLHAHDRSERAPWGPSLTCRSSVLDQSKPLQTKLGYQQHHDVAFLCIRTLISKYFKCMQKNWLKKDFQMTLPKHCLYIYFLSKVRKFKSIYNLHIVHYMVHTDNDIYGAPHSDKKEAQLGSSHQCSVSIYSTSLQQRTVLQHWELRFHLGKVASILSH